MIYLISNVGTGGRFAELEAMHRLRYRVFKERLGWQVQTASGMEADEFDLCNPHYLLQANLEGDVTGCVRLLPTLGPNMLRDVFSDLLDGNAPPANERIWESSRFAVESPWAERQASKTSLRIPTERRTFVSTGTFELFAGMVEFGLSRHLEAIATVTDLRMERILRRAGWPLDRLGSPRAIGNTTAVAGLLEVSSSALAAIRRAGHVNRPALWLSATSLVPGLEPMHAEPGVRLLA